MDFIQILILSTVQGITEFLPISSSSHLILASEILGFPDQGIGFDIALHVGSLLAILFYYKKEMKEILHLSDHGKAYLKIIFIGSIPLPIFGLLFVDYISLNLRSSEFIAVMTILFGLLLLFADRYNSKNKNLLKINIIPIGIIFFIGLMQALAVFPGVSRSGIVITTALLVGLSRIDSIRISLLLSIPALFMAGVYQSYKLIDLNESVLFYDSGVGLLLSFLFSYITIYLFIETINKLSFLPYIIYRLLLGFALFILV